MLRLILSIKSVKIFVVYYSVACCTIPNLKGQISELSNPYIDSLKQQLEFVSDTAKVDLLNKIAYNYYFYNHDSTDDYAAMAIKLATTLDYKKGLSEAQRQMGISLNASNEEKEGIAWIYKGLETAQSINYHQGIADNLNSIGVFYYSIEDYNQAISYYKQSVIHQKRASNRLREGIIYSNIGGVFLLKNMLDSSLFYFQKAEYILDSIGEEKWIAMIKSEFGGLLIKLNSLKKAEEYSKLALEISQRIGQSLHLRKSYQNLAKIYLVQNRYSEAQKMADLALIISKEFGFIPILIEAYEIEYKISEKQQRYKSALSYHKKYTLYRDSLRKKQNHDEANLHKYQKELEDKEKENLILRNEKESQKALIQQQNILGIGGIIILIIVSMSAIILFRLRRKEQETNAKISISNKKLEEQKEEVSATLQMVEHLNAHLQAQNNALNKTAIVSLTDLQGHIISVNDNFCDVTGYSRDELLGGSHRIIDSGEHSKQEFSDLWNTITKGNIWRNEIKNRKKNGTYFWVDTAISPIFNDDGKPKQFFSLQFDITERKNYLDQLTIKGKELEDLNKLKDKLLSIVSHDFRSPLNSLRGTLSLFLKGALSKEELNMLTESLVDKLDNTYNLLENLLNWAKSQMQGMKVYAKKINLKAISEDCIDLLTPIADKKHVKITSHIKTSVVAFADNEMVKLVIRNLMSNAIKFTTTGNNIILEAIPDEDKVTISVADNGTGISNENQDKLFKLDNFSTIGTSNESGIGLGLLLCKDFVEKNGGEIWFESELEKGSTFYFTLPTKEKDSHQNHS